MAKKIQYAVNDTQIYQLTGCMSSCDKYHFSTHPRSDLKFYHSNISSLMISFMIPNGHNEVKEQVNSIISTSFTENDAIKQQNKFQYWLYDFDSFIADVGGYLGLLLGQSIFGAHQILSEWLARRLHKKKPSSKQ